IRNPDGSLPNGGSLNYYNMHLSRPEPQWSPGMGHYRAIVDLMGHSQLVGKTLLYLVDGLYAGYYWDAHPYKWNTAPFNGDWPSSLFASQDAVAIDSVTYDFLLAEWPDVVTGGDGAPGSLQGGEEDYLHEAALADDPPSGTFYDPEKDAVRMASLGVHEHWDDPIHKRYGRNLGTGSGIELISVTYDEGAIGRAKCLADNASTIVAGAVVTAASADCFYIEADDRSNGIRIEKSAHGFSSGTFGKVTYSTTGYFYVHDGCELQDNSGHIGIKVLGTAPVGEGENPVGRFVRVTGISSCFKAPDPGTDLYRLIRATDVLLRD
ncbi:MAG: hypothetical protein NTU88_15650, partial [Armatimonadetes bacterium]|nr:hypothetical protein [Armatimonadota bacterium]